MKLKLLTVAVAAAAVLPTANAFAADSGPTLYGKINASINYNDPEAGDGSFDVQDNASRIGVKGEEDLGGISGVYQLEFGTQVSDGSGINSSRNSFVGLKGDFGTVYVGKHDSPFKAAQGKIDLFGDTDLDFGEFLGGEEREANVIGWKSPSYGGVKFFAQVQPGEQDSDNENETLDGAADAVSVSASYELDGLYVAAAYDMNATWGFWDDASYGAVVPTTPATNVIAERTDAFRLVGTYKMDNMGFGALYQSAEQSDLSDAAEQSGFLLSGYVMADQTKFKAAFGQSTLEQTGTTDLDLTYYALGVDQILSKRTTLYVNYGNLNSDRDADAVNSVAAVDADNGVFMVGAVHSF
ncbi:MAG TPA: hypothetical protein DHW71_11155 [Gammaproteobacteria bacterium]|nr:hypothetical protein [Gammaproteobacteria bacterium]HBF08291.1 hypothetical protein [Gammaproteobacteria bacterium]HCK93541.1 hypothetical protein [Gammaproteobacteria bacterium]|tara:strand:+ start:2282 stop:3343 length:1062 start_codon:yes stop_codon:yes gene_type:complete